MAVSPASTLSLVGGALAFDFANTGSGREMAETTEHLREPIDVVDWARHAGGIDSATAGRLRGIVAVEADVGTRLLRQARDLRAAIQATGSAIANKRLPADADLKTLKAFAGRAIGRSVLRRRSGGGYAYDFSGARPEAAVLGPIACSAVDVLAQASSDRIKQCPECNWLFLDHSKNNSRRWCDMATCGNRIKLRRHRERR